ncbi:uncharacterized protein LOC116247401 [Nymphaea colorata]|uniref:Uncharacterized protein n=1 Tax=Nymphaea colorata TaxID=210225 RepID=A0A5K1A2M7_9MAGN|nr:uncharacterized protein LOC116247401 [Nymphaea colorata]
MAGGSLVLRLMSKRRTWAALFAVVYALLLSSSWTLVRSTFSAKATTTAAAAATKFPWSAVYASVLLGAAVGVLSMLAVLALAVPSMLFAWITILVLLALDQRRPSRSLVLEGRKITAEMSGMTLRIMLQEGRTLAALCVIFSFFLLTTLRHI